jgi:hypothetical protein
MRPLRFPPFRRLALGKSISYLGDWLMVAVLVGWVYQSTSSVSQVALLMAIRLVPPIVGGGLAASLVDRLPRQRVLVWSETACAATIGGALVAVMAGSRPAVFAFVGLCGLVSMVSTVAGNALIPMVVEQDELPAANGIHAVSDRKPPWLGRRAGGLTLAVGGACRARRESRKLRNRRVLRAIRAEARQGVQKDTSRRRVGRDGLRYVLRHRGLTVVARSVAFGTPRHRARKRDPAEVHDGSRSRCERLRLGARRTRDRHDRRRNDHGTIAERVEPRWMAFGLADGLPVLRLCPVRRRRERAPLLAASVSRTVTEVR